MNTHKVLKRRAHHMSCSSSHRNRQWWRSQSHQDAEQGPEAKSEAAQFQTGPIPVELLPDHQTAALSLRLKQSCISVISMMLNLVCCFFLFPLFTGL
ncbi:hypothetical protein RchiOBHm_Chr5g0080111 [Rosa chinensis]|uniref:Uncharacterized protein n=1 Tax=Rosa chinensis TaxID=74649 RepID=A0A2P6QMN7_ROSCH|nr:hypothetical protein RchiOBHm_Chr5g0080111 [Rosa chinensis]